MCNSVPVEVSNPRDYLLEDLARFMFFQSTALNDVVVQITLWSALHKDAHIFSCLDNFVLLDDMWMSASTQDADLSLNLLLGPFFLKLGNIVDLDSNFLVRR